MRDFETASYSILASPMTLLIYLLVVGLILWPALYVINGMAQVAR
jgi:hypothetical protein